jgi:UrcA family protein
MPLSWFESVGGGDQHDDRGLSTRAAQESHSGVLKHRHQLQLTPREKTMTIATSTFNYCRTSAALTALTACLLVGATTVRANTPTDVPSITVGYSDLNLDTVQGSNALYARIASAAREVCGVNQVNIRDLNSLTIARTCETRAISQAVHEVHNPALAALSSVRVRHG